MSAQADPSSPSRIGRLQPGMHVCRPDDGSKTNVACTRSASSQLDTKTPPGSVAGTYDLKQAKLRESGTESHKFYLKMPGNALVTLKTETPCVSSLVTHWGPSSHMLFVWVLCAMYS
jgi:hypothetical protein